MPILQASPFLEHLLRVLIPYFTDFAPDFATARVEAIETLASYGARTRAELLCATQVIVFGFATLEALHEAKTTEMSPSMRLRFRSCANNLNRSGQRTEQALIKRLDRQEPTAADVDKDPANDLTAAQADEVLQQTQAEIDAYRNRAAGKPPAAGAQASSPAAGQDNQRLWGKAMMDTLAEMGMPVRPTPKT